MAESKPYPIKPSVSARRKARMLMRPLHQFTDEHLVRSVRLARKVHRGRMDAVERKARGAKAGQKRAKWDELETLRMKGPSVFNPRYEELLAEAKLRGLEV